MTLHIARILRIVPYIPYQPQKKSTAEIHEYLTNSGFEVSRRQVERDLLQLQAAFPLANDDEKKRGWFWPRDAELPFSGVGLDVHSSLAFKLVEQHLCHLLPKVSLRKLCRYFNEAKQVLTQVRGLKTSDWTSRVVTISPGIPLEPPDVDEQVESLVSNALLERKILKIQYRKRNGEVKDYSLAPAGLVARLGVIYLVADYEGSESLHFFALHRILKADLTELEANVASAESFKKTLSQGALGFSISEEGLKVTLRFSYQAGIHLTESRFSPDQEVQVLPDGRLEIKGTIPNNLESRWWIFGFGPGVEVVEPADLREEISKGFQDALALYNK